jgi:hypothetical protein
VKNNPCTEDDSIQATPDYTPDSPAIIQVVARGVGSCFNERDRTRITTDITLGKEIDKKEEEHLVKLMVEKKEGG